MSPSPYISWSKDDLVSRIQSLEKVLVDSIPASSIPLPVKHTLPESNQRPPQLPPSLTPKQFKKAMKAKKPFDFASHPRRKIALKFCYSGWEYNGLAFQKEPTPLPMVEAVLLEALSATKLIDGEKGMEGCGWSRCGRTDKGVSGAGQVVALWVRSAVGLRKMKERARLDSAGGADRGDVDAPYSEAHHGSSVGHADADKLPRSEEQLSDEETELRYIHMLNSVLPSSIRILAWSPVKDDFDARFSCTFRHYKYFFTPGIPPHVPSHSALLSDTPPVDAPPHAKINTHVLDIEAMQTAASKLVGEHDFRNFCKIDPSKQIENYSRNIFHASISTLDPFDTSTALAPQYMAPVTTREGPTVPPACSAKTASSQVYVFDLLGNGFLWHQVRHIMALLFMIGARVEKPSVVDALFNTDEQNPLSHNGSDPQASLPLVATKPVYEMADGLPLVLWDCGYASQDVQWRIDDYSGLTPSNANGTTSEQLHLDIRHMAERNLVKMTMQNHFALAATRFHPLQSSPHQSHLTPSAPSTHVPVRVPLGAGSVYQTHKYVPILDRPRGERAEVLNERWKNGAGARKVERKAAAGAGAGTEVPDK